jgi:hypothetical protein
VIIVSLEHPISFVYVIVVVPADIPVTSPLFETVATAVLLEDQGFVAAAVALPVNCKVELIQTDEPPEIVGNGFTVMVMEAVVAHCPVLGVNV